MLAITDNAADAIRNIIAAPEIPDGAGLRIEARADGAQSNTLAVSVVALPAETDQVLDEDGARVFVEDDCADMLDDKLLDAQVEGGRVGFTLSDQP